jgi:hypothetical protein
VAVTHKKYDEVIREMIFHENELTSHRMGWFCLNQGFLWNAFVLLRIHAAEDKDLYADTVILCCAGITSSTTFPSTWIFAAEAATESKFNEQMEEMEKRTCG